MRLTTSFSLASTSRLLRPQSRGKDLTSSRASPSLWSRPKTGFSSLHQRLSSTGARPDQILVVMEATGIYWLAFATFFARQGYAISVVNPSQAHHFAKALLKRAKTDAIDAQT